MTQGRSPDDSLFKIKDDLQYTYRLTTFSLLVWQYHQELTIQSNALLLKRVSFVVKEGWCQFLVVKDQII